MPPEAPTVGWWRRHGVTAALLVTAFSVAILIRTVFMAQVVELWGPFNVYGGGSDSFYHSRVMEYIILNHHNLGRDTLLNYPIGAVNPREPLFDWMNAVLGILFAPLFGGNAVTAGAWFLDAGGPIWAGLGVFPVYLIGREASSRRMGIVAAFLYPLMVANIDSSTFGYANYLAFYTFFILLTVYSLLRTFKAVGSHRWVESYRSPRSIVAGLKGFLRTERTAVKWAVFAGVSFGTLALAWQGYTFVVATIVIFLAVALVIERIRRVDSFGLYVAVWIVGLVGFPMAMPYYLRQGLFAGWFDIPLLLYFGALLVVTPFLFLRDYPWVVSLPVLAAIGGAASGILYLIAPASFITLVTGQGYFVKTLVYSTVAEAQAPSIDQLILGYGVVTFFLAFVGLALYTWQTTRTRFRRTSLLFLVFAVVSVYLPVSAAKFFFLGSAAFSLLAGEAIVRAIDVGGYSTLRRNVASLADRRSQWAAFRRAFKIRHVLVMLLLLIVVLPNVWYAIDAGIPYNEKSNANLQVYNTLPPPLRTNPASASTFYLGAAGTQLDTPNQYDEDGYNWLAGQDQNLPPPDRPAFVSWWDYGFQAVAQGDHPTVADNFQNGIDPAGNFLLAQNESLAIGILTTRLLTAELTETGSHYLPSGLAQVLVRDHVDVGQLNNLLVNASNDIPLVIGHPDRYLAVDASHLDATNALYDATSYFLASTLPISGVAQVYDDVQSYTGWSIRYAMVDSRLFPVAGSSTGIFYAPADLTDRVIGSGGVPTSYYSVTVTGSDGSTYPLGSVPPGVLATNYNIQYYPAFYNSMIYHIFAGYNGSDIGQGDGIPGLTTFVGNSIASNLPEPGWMLEHFQVVYRTAYYCPYADPASHPNCYVAKNLVDAQALAKAQNGTVTADPSAYYGVNGGGGETILEYYAGQTMTGTVTLPGGAPVAGALVTVYDGWGIPHMIAQTDAHGVYSVVLPPGNDTVNVTTGSFNPLTESGGTTLVSLHLPIAASQGLNPESPALVRPIVLAPATVSGFLYWNNANNSSYIAGTDSVVPGASVVLWGGPGGARTVPTDASGAFSVTGLAPGVYNMSVRYQGANFTEPMLTLSTGATQNATTGLTPASLSGKVFIPQGGFGAQGATVTVSGPTGVVGTAVTNESGEYAIPNLGPGNYSVRAAEASMGWGTVAVPFSITTAGTRTVVNLTAVPVTTVEVAVLANDEPVAGIPVRFTPIASAAAGNGSSGTGNGSTAPIGAAPPLSPQNSTVFTSNAFGFVSATVPTGNYSLYALGLVGTTLEAGFSSAYLPSGVGALELAPLSLAPAVRLNGTAGSSSATTPTKVTAYDTRGASVIAVANASGDWALYLPQGTYSLLAIQPTSTTDATAPVLSAAKNVTLVYPTTVDLPVGPSVVVSAEVGTPTYTNGPGFFPAARAEVRLGLSTGWSVAALSTGAGNVSFTVPATVPTGTSYCLSVAAEGFEPYAACGLTPSDLTAATTIPLRLTPVPVNLTVFGLPGGSKVTVNFTAESATASTVNATGGPTFSFSVAPGTYSVTAWGPSPVAPGLLRPTSPINATIGIGSAGETFTLTVRHEVDSAGGLVLPTGLLNASVALSLSSATANLTVGGDTFTTGFFAPPGTYTAFARGVAAGNGSSAGTTYTGLSTVTINATGAIQPAVAVTSAAAELNGSLALSTGGPPNGTVGVTLAGPPGVTVAAAAVGGNFTAEVPANATYTVLVNTTQLVGVGSTARYEVFVASAGATCFAAYPVSGCQVTLEGTALTATLNGTVVARAYPGPAAASIELVGPYPSTATVSVAAPSGAFSASLAPGSYAVYATGGTGFANLANLTRVTVSATAPTALALTLVPTWTDTVTIARPQSSAAVSAPTLTVASASGANLTIAGAAFGAPLALALPVGIYTVSARSTGSPYGVSANATASTSVVLAAGNAATHLGLAFDLSPRVVLTLVTPGPFVVPGGQTVNGIFVARNVGNAPAAVSFLGSPSTWNFTLTPANASLGVLPGNDSVTVDATVRVPAGTLAAPPAASLLAEYANGTAAGPATVWTIATEPYVSMSAGVSASGTSVAPKSGTVSFWIANLGNVAVRETITVENPIALAADGWTAEIDQGSGAVTAPPSLAPQSNTTFSVKLNATTPYAVAPGEVDLALVGSNGTLSARTTLKLPVPVLSVSLGNGTGLTVTGPSVGAPSPYPDWLVPVLAFSPTFALLVGLVVYRWWRTRRWSRR
ncbi:MAG TPA: carboxypeptidase regulatory-like domain-containing protein [Thermoplasmata archaeon]|nr:carboxypeptidase regulatory-like domain-containing protein [Thermoplasmata archaeon]